MRVISFFAGCGGLDLGFKQAGFEVVWANEFDKNIHATYRLNHSSTILCEKDLREIDLSEIPDADGFIGGPPCQSWSVGGRGRGLHDERGQLFLKYIEIIKQKHPKFFVIENVFGMLTHQHISTFLIFIDTLEKANYNVHYAVLNAVDYRIPQDRKRVFIVGFSSELNCSFSFPKPENYVVSLRQAIGDITENPQFYSDFDDVPLPPLSNHDVYTGPFDTKFMARNRVRSWGEPSFTIQAQAKNAPLHPQAPPMRYVSSSKRIFEPGFDHLYRRLSVRECARIQTFPDSFKFIYSDVKMGYKMVGNAVPPRLAKSVALSVREAFEEKIKDYNNTLVAFYHNERQLIKCEELSVFYFRASLDINAYNPLKYLPSYLILANGKNRFLYEIDTTIKPALVSREDLIKLGFIPHSFSYWIIHITKRLRDISNYKTKWKDKRKRSPYLDVVSIGSL